MINFSRTIENQLAMDRTNNGYKFQVSSLCASGNKLYLPRDKSPAGKVKTSGRIAVLKNYPRFIVDKRTVSFEITSRKEGSHADEQTSNRSTRDVESARGYEKTGRAHDKYS